MCGCRREVPSTRSSELYKRDVDLTLIDECLKRTVEERLIALQDQTAKAIEKSR
jgi:hypothetical protein